MKFLKFFSQKVACLEQFILSVGLLVMVLITFTQVVLRAFDHVILWADPLARQLVLWVGFLGAAVATEEGQHINIDALTRFIAPRWKSAVMAFINLFGTVISSLLFYAAVKFVVMEKASGMTIFLDVPAWIGELVIPVAFFLVAFRLLIRVLENMTAFFKGVLE